MRGRLEVKFVPPEISIRLETTEAQTNATAQLRDDDEADDQLVVIEPARALVSLPFGDLWRYRELLVFLAWRDVKVRYKQTALGAAWALLQPLLTMLIFSLFFTRLASEATRGVPYPLFALAGLVLWTFFANAVTMSGNSLVGSSALITKVYFPRAIIPAAAVFAGIVDLAVSAVLLVALALWYGVRVTPALAFAPLFVMLAALAALGAGAWLSALNVKYRDVRYALPFIVQLWMFASSVIVPAALVPARLRWVIYANPLTGIVENFRGSLFGTGIDWRTTAVSAVITLALLLTGLLYFQRAEETFADIV
jgi:lipopolysaccharide transport system permease protein